MLELWRVDTKIQETERFGYKLEIITLFLLQISRYPLSSRRISSFRISFLALPGGCNDIGLRWGGWMGGDLEEAVYGGLLLMAGCPPTYPLP